jgi:hypothetical protein
VKRPIAAVAAGAFLLAGCAQQPYRPVVDTANSHPAPGHTYADDLSACQALADQRDTASAGASGAVAGAVLGALLGAIVGAGTGYSGALAAQGAGIGAIGGGATSAAASEGNKEAIVQRCLLGRGWNVVGR